MGLFALPDSSRLPLDYRFLASGDSPQTAQLTSGDRASWRRMLGLRQAPPGDTVADASYWQLTHGADPRGEAGPKPLMLSSRRQWRLSLAGHIARTTELADGGIEREKSRDVFRLAYAELMESDPDLADKSLGFEARKWQLKGDEWKDFQPPRHRGRPPKKPETAVSDDFNRSDEELSTGNWTELGSSDWEVVSNEAEKLDTNTSAASRLARYDTALSGTDHYSQVDITALTRAAGTIHYGVMCRKDNTATATCYFTYANEQGNTSDDKIFLWKLVSGTFTQLAVSASAKTYSFPETIYLSCDGSDQQVKWNGANEISGTDTAISANNYIGLYGLQNTAGANTLTGDDFEGGDLSAPASTPRLTLLGAG